MPNASAVIRFVRLITLALPFCAGASHADDVEGFVDAANGAVVHSQSGFVCPLKIGEFERDAAGRRDPDTEADYCAYSALPGSYATVIVMPLRPDFDAKEGLKREFAVQEGTGGFVVGETVQQLGGGLPVYSRTYENARLESLHYRTQFSNAVIGAWSVQVILEFAHPRDDKLANSFLSRIYDAAQRQIGSPGNP